MDTADRFINNRAPKQIVLFYIIALILSLAAGFFFADRCSEKINETQLRYVLSAVGGDSEFIGIPDDEKVSAGEKITERYGITLDVSPRVFESFRVTRRIIFIPYAVICFIVCTSWLLISLRPLFRIYRDMEKLTDECIRIAEKGGRVEGRYGGTFSCIRRVSDGVDLIGKRMVHLVSGLEADKEFLRDFLTDFSHQLKTSLAVVRLNNDMLDSLDNLTEEKADQLSVEINTSIDDMEALVFSALKLAKINAGSVQYEKTEGNLSDLCRKSLYKVRSILKSKNINYSLDYDTEIKFFFDEVWLTEAITNLIKNSADHSGCSDITVSVYETPVSAGITIEDNGKGIPQSAIPGIFERFGKCSNKSGMDSVGVGMSIAEKIVRAHNGEILIYSGEGKGTKFEIIFLK